MSIQTNMDLISKISAHEAKAFEILSLLLCPADLRLNARCRLPDTKGDVVAFHIYDDLAGVLYVSVMAWAEEKGKRAYAREFRFSLVNKLSRVSIKSFSEKLQLRVDIERMPIAEHERVLSQLVAVLQDLIDADNKHPCE